MINNEEDVFGKIFMFDFNQPDKPVRELEILGDSKPGDLNPLGLDIWEHEGNYNSHPTHTTG